MLIKWGGTFNRTPQVFQAAQRACAILLRCEIGDVFTELEKFETDSPFIKGEHYRFFYDPLSIVPTAESVSIGVDDYQLHFEVIPDGSK